jgi:hypothetical protein
MNFATGFRILTLLLDGIIALLKKSKNHENKPGALQSWGSVVLHGRH